MVFYNRLNNIFSLDHQFSNFIHYSCRPKPSMRKGRETGDNRKIHLCSGKGELVEDYLFEITAMV